MKFNFLIKIVFFVVTISLTGCMTTTSINQALLNENSRADTKKLSEWQKFANEGYSFLKKGDYTLASEKFNNALKFDIKNSNKTKSKKQKP